MFWLGTGMPSWLARTATPLMVTRARMPKRRLPRALGPWFLDSGAFTELAAAGRFTTSTAEHVHQVQHLAERVGNLAAAAVQDWLCTPDVLRATGLSVRAHQALTTASYLACRQAAPDVPWVPTLQGWYPSDYLLHLDDYTEAGVDLGRLPLVGVGSVANRQHTDTARVVFTELRDAGLPNLHAYGAKRAGLVVWGWAVRSADSQAWSIDARRARAALCGADHPTCRNCLAYAEAWGHRTGLLLGQADPGHRQLALGGGL